MRKPSPERHPVRHEVSLRQASQAAGTSVMEVRACFRVPRQSQFRHDSSNYVLVAENAFVRQERESLSSRVEHHPPAWKFLILELRRHSAFLLESCPHG